MQIVIADDEKLIRAGIKKILESAFKDLEIHEAKNGKEAFDLCASISPDLLITDIRMPIMDGVELMKQISSLSTPPYIIVISGFDDFSYAKAAIASGALSYVLKPVDKNELLSAVEKVMSLTQAQRERHNAEALKQASLSSSLVHGGKTERIQFPDGMCCLVSYGENCQSVLKEVFKDFTVYVLEQHSHYICLVMPASLMESVRNDKRFSNLVTGLSSVSSSSDDIKKLRHQAHVAQLCSYFTDESGLRTNGVYVFKEECELPDYADMDDIYQKLLLRMDLLSVTDVLKLIDTVFDFSAYPNCQRASVLLFLHDAIENNLFRRYAFAAQEDSYLHAKEFLIGNIIQSSSIKEWKSYVSDYIIYTMMLLKKQNGEFPYITKALAFMQEHFTDPELTMATVSNEVDCNYTWFSEKFREQTGLNFNDYLKRMRLEKAKQLLEAGTFKVYEVAERSGFHDSKYFMKAFREATGMKPSEWAKQD